MAVHIDHNKCCYAKGICDCVPVNGKSKNNPLNISTSQKCCVEVCPAGALSRNKYIIADNALCTECGECIKICCGGAIKEFLDWIDNADGQEVVTKVEYFPIR